MKAFEVVGRGTLFIMLHLTSNKLIIGCKALYIQGEFVCGFRESLNEYTSSNVFYLLKGGMAVQSHQ